MDTTIVAVDGESLTIDDVVQVARYGKKVELLVQAIELIKKSRDVVETAIKEETTVYGVNTGFGELANVCISSEDLAKLQVNLIRSHSVGVGNPFPLDVVRGMILLRANALAKG
ncbi:MAG: aromatic amino acid lyase, partial [Candidatus Thorarchaeota archaeon]